MFVSRMLALLAAGTAIAPAAVSAAPVITVSDTNAAIVRQMHVQTTDLNLASAADQRKLQNRVNHAVGEVCSLNDVPDNFENGRCRQAAMQGAKAQIADAMARSAPHYAEAKTQSAAPNTASGS
ncbi:UrcA family protein [Sphingomonas vulcanisoli]|uniref:UrcA family protein n=1 Tax=Sphingomonas vulcanisoli TaxID=1658060 RepID=A0ABX0TMQ0_9SPHN|nr:UrcA family protein [Sphingomonas vulcanisoli]NIJ06796.1 UrcA family protein [Sphingomonas vulcanisoli]